MEAPHEAHEPHDIQVDLVRRLLCTLLRCSSGALVKREECADEASRSPQNRACESEVVARSMCAPCLGAIYSTSFFITFTLPTTSLSTFFVYKLSAPTVADVLTLMCCPVIRS